MSPEPLPGPIESDPTPDLIGVPEESMAAARAMLDSAVAELDAAGVQLGAYDRRILDWVAGWDQPTVATVASLLYRAVTASPDTQVEAAASEPPAPGTARVYRLLYEAEAETLAAVAAIHVVAVEQRAAGIDAREILDDVLHQLGEVLA